MHLTTDWPGKWSTLPYLFKSKIKCTQCFSANSKYDYKTLQSRIFLKASQNCFSRLTCFNQRDVHFLWPPAGSYGNHWFFSVLAEIFLTKVKDYNEPALRCFVATLLCSVTVNELLMKPETHYISRKKPYKDWRKQRHTRKP